MSYLSVPRAYPRRQPGHGDRSDRDEPPPRAIEYINACSCATHEIASRAPPFDRRLATDGRFRAEDDRWLTELAKASYRASRHAAHDRNDDAERRGHGRNPTGDLH